MRATIWNESPLPRQSWVFLTMPADVAKDIDLESTFVAGDGARWRAVKGKTIQKTTGFRVRLAMSGRETVSGTFVNERHPDAGEFRLHPWAGDGPDPNQEVRPQARFKLPAGDETIQLLETVTGPTLVQSGPAHQLYHIRTRSPSGEYLEWWTEFRHDDPVAVFEGLFVWSDRADPSMTKAYQNVVITCGEQLAFDFRHRWGNTAANPERENWGHLVARHPNLDDGTCLPLSGSMLCYVSPSGGPTLPAEGSAGEWDFVQAGLRDLRAAGDGRLRGVSHDWDGSWLSCKHVPRVNLPPKSVKVVLDSAWAGHEAEMLVRASYSVNRPLGALPKPGSTGEQEDHGATKGTHAVSFHDPRWITRAIYSAQAEVQRRAYHHYEANGWPLNVAGHQGWDTYGAETWRTSSDTLGKLLNYPITPVGGYAGYDEEHVSWNLLAATIALTHSPSLLNHVEHMVAVCEADYRMKYPGFGIGAARAQGRTLGGLSQLYQVSAGDVASRIKNLIARRVQGVAENPSLHVAGPMCVPQWRDPDNRKKIWTDSTRSVYAPWVSMWEAGLFIVGLKQCVDGMGLGLSPLRIVCETIAEFGCALRADGWWTTDDILWSNGDAPPGWPDPHPWHIVWNPGAHATGHWTRAGIIVAREVLGSGHKLSAKMDEYIKDTGGYETTDQTIAEWTAAVKIPRA